jgi:hypothetical protein
MTMSAEEYKRLLKGHPFSPVRFKLSDGRHVDVRHPDQAVVTTTHIYVPISSIDQYDRLATAETTESVADDWILVNLMHIASVQSVNGRPRPSEKPTASDE